MIGIRRHAGICCLAGAVVLAWAHEGGAQDKPAAPAASVAFAEQELAALPAAVDALSTGKQRPDLTVSWLGHHFIRSQGDSIYVPFTVGVDKGQVAGPPVAVYVRAVARLAPNRSSKFAWEGTYVVDMPADGRIPRAIALAPGTYDVYVAVKGKSAAAVPGRTVVTHHELIVPSLAGPELTTSSVILASALEQLPAPLPPEKQEDNPYVFGPHKLTPSIERVFLRSGELHLWFMIYEASETAGKPDVQVDLSFHQKLPEGDKYFNRTVPQELNEKTLAPDFNLTLGHQLVSRFSVALATFQPGDYRLEIKVTDRPSGRSLTSNVNFAVSAS